MAKAPAVPSKKPSPVAIAALEAVLDRIVAAAQHDGDKCRWGQHVQVDAQHNLNQFGLHGTSQAVIALSASSGTASRWHRCLVGGQAWLSDRVNTPKKPADQRKTLKQAELLTSLSVSGAAAEARTTVLERLWQGWDTECRGWHFELAPPAQSHCHPIPTLYVLRAMLSGGFDAIAKEERERFLLALSECCARISQLSPIGMRHAVGCLCIFSLDAGWEQTAIHDVVRDRLPVLFDETAAIPVALRHSERHEYLVRTDSGQSDHAFCTLPSGLLHLWTGLIAKERGLALGSWIDDAPARLADLIELVWAPGGLGLALTEEHAMAALILSRFGHLVPDDPRNVRSPSHWKPGPGHGVQRWIANHWKAGLAGGAMTLAGASFVVGFKLGNLEVKSDLVDTRSALHRTEGILEERQRALNLQVAKLAFLDSLSRFLDAKLRADAEAMAVAQDALDRFVEEQSHRFAETSGAKDTMPEGIELLQGGDGTSPEIRFQDGTKWPVNWRTAPPQEAPRISEPPK